MHNMNLLDLKLGNTGIVKGFTDLNLSVKLMEMGCLPGEKVTYLRVAPLGDPISILIAGYQLSLRKEEAATILVQPV